LTKTFFILLIICTSIVLAEETTSIEISKFLHPITIDGYLDEIDWKNSARIQEFYAFRPVDGKPADEQTAVLLGYSENSLYIALICFDPNPSQIRASITKRDEIFDDDFVILYLDTFNDGKYAYQIAVNPYGIQADGIVIEAVGEDFNPDFVFYSNGRRFKKGYILEIEIPFKSLRFPIQHRLIWGMSVLRRINHLDKDIIWPAISRNLATFVPQFGKITGLSNISPGNNIELLPEITSNQQGNLVNNKFSEGPIEYDAGVNLKYGITSNFTFDLAYNPDFSQIEADADKIDVNRRYPLYYDEKRPFFLEGTNIFYTPINAVYTRNLVDPIVGLKATGQIGDYSVGILGGIDPYYGTSEYLADISKYQHYYDPGFNQNDFINSFKNKDSYHGVFRLKKNIWDYSSIGVLATDKEQGDVYSRTIGVDGRFIIASQYVLSFQALHSLSKNYFDTKQKENPAYKASLYKGSRTFSYQLFYTDIYPDFEAANGFLERTDIREFGAYLWYDFLSDKSFFKMIRPNIYSYRTYNHENQQIEQMISPALTFELRGQTECSLSYIRMMEEFYGSNFNKNQYMLSFTNKTFSWLFLNVEAIAGDGIFYDGPYYYSIPPFLGFVHNIVSGLELKPTSQWSTEFKVSNYMFKGRYNSNKYRVKQDIYRIKSTYQFTRSLFLRAIAEHNTYYKEVEVNVLLSYQFIPGTVFFLGYNDYFVENSSKNYHRYARGFFTKFSYLFRF